MDTCPSGGSLVRAADLLNWLMIRCYMELLVLSIGNVSGRVGHLPNVVSFPVVSSRCWTADRLARRNLNHPEAFFCAQEMETINHLLLSCVFSRKILVYAL
jgi:hypothetical protein